MEMALCSALPRDDLIHYVEAVQYDETELSTRVIGDSKRAPQTSVADVKLPGVLAIANSASSSSICKIGAAKRLTVKASQAPQKIMQTRSDVAMVVRLGGRLVTIVLHAPCPLSVLERCSAKCIQQQQLLLSRAGKAAFTFGGFLGPQRRMATLPTSVRRGLSLRRGRGQPKTASACTFCVGCTAQHWSATKRLPPWIPRSAGQFVLLWLSGQGRP